MNRVENREQFYAEVERDIIHKSTPQLKGLTPGQVEYLDSINSSILTMCSGCAGTGKTYMAVVRGIELMREHRFERLLVARPAVECGKSLGFLPGDMGEKVAPYMRPILDIMRDQIPMKILQEYIAEELIELAALSYMRGRTLNNCIMILDEAQNATWEELTMFLTRIGKNSKIIITGDESQRDNFNRDFSECLDRWDSPPFVDGASVVELGEEDVVRNDFIRKIITKMERK